MKKLISNNKLLAIINVIFITLVVAQEMEYIDVFPVSDAWKKFLKTTIALVVAVYNYYKLNTPKNV